MDPTLIAALGSGLLFAFQKVVDKGFIDPVSDSGLEPFRNWVMSGYTRIKDEEKLRQALLIALDETTKEFGNDLFARLFITNKLTGLSHQNLILIAAATIETVDSNPALVPERLFKTLEIEKDDKRRELISHFLYNFRNELVKIDTYSKGIFYYNQIYANGRLAGLTNELAIMSDRLSTIDDTENILIKERKLTKDEQSALKSYLSAVRSQLQLLPLPLARSAPGHPKHAKLEEVYVPLQLHRIDNDSAFDLGDAIKQSNRFIVLGPPGSGKTTALRYLALAFASGAAQKFLSWDKNSLFPIFIRLRNFGNYLDENRLSYTDPAPGVLTSYLDNYFRQEYRIPLTPDFFDRRLDEGNCIILMDGLDELSENRTDVTQHINSFIQYYGEKGNHIGISSRPRGFEAVELFLRRSSLDVYVLNPLNLKSIWKLMSNLLNMFEKNVLLRQKDLDGLLRVIENSFELIQLAGTPLFCTALVLVYKYHGAELPQRRVDVFREIVDLLLGFWKAQEQELARAHQLAQEDGTGEAFRELGAAVVVKKKRLGELSLVMQKDHKTEIKLLDAIEILSEYMIRSERKDPVIARIWAENFLYNAHERSGILAEVEPGAYSFTHEGFREYLAASALINLREGQFVQTVLDHLLDDRWEQVLLLASAHSDLSDAQRGFLLQEIMNYGNNAHKKGDKTTWLRYLTMAGRMAGDMSEHLPGPERTFIENELYQIMISQELSPSERAYTADVLDAIGWIPKGLFDFIHIEGNGEICEFEISKFPLTNLQYSRFLESEDFFDEDLWRNLPNFNSISEQISDIKEDGWIWLQKTMERRRQRVFPEYWHDMKFGIFRRLVPIVGISWYEASAYCKWLTKHWAELDEGRKNPDIKSSFARLSTEKEWNYVFQANKPPTYLPWENPGEPSVKIPLEYCANVGKLINRTTAVGMYPMGESYPFKVAELVGNVQEWQANLFNDKYNWRTVCGSSYSDLRRPFTMKRYRRNPELRNNDRGFRIVIQIKD